MRNKSAFDDRIPASLQGQFKARSKMRSAFGGFIVLHLIAGLCVAIAGVWAIISLIFRLVEKTPFDTRSLWMLGISLAVVIVNFVFMARRTL